MCALCTAIPYNKPFIYKTISANDTWLIQMVLQDLNEVHSLSVPVCQWMSAGYLL